MARPVDVARAFRKHGTRRQLCHETKKRYYRSGRQAERAASSLGGGQHFAAFRPLPLPVLQRLSPHDAGAEDMITGRLVVYVAHPLAPTDEQVAAECDHPEPKMSALMRNLNGALRWLSWLRRSFPETTFIAPWIAAIYAGEDDADPRAREAGLVDADAVVPLCTGVALCGGRISSGMGREDANARRSWDLTPLGAEPPAGVTPGQPWLIWAADCEAWAPRGARP